MMGGRTLWVQKKVYGGRPRMCFPFRGRDVWMKVQVRMDQFRSLDEFGANQYIELIEPSNL